MFYTSGRYVRGPSRVSGSGWKEIVIELPNEKKAQMTCDNLNELVKTLTDVLTVARFALNTCHEEMPGTRFKKQVFSDTAVVGALRRIDKAIPMVSPEPPKPQG